MKIREIEIDGFGVWRDLKLQELPDHALVIYGPNEAGKTTLMQFVRTILYGFSPHRRARYMPPVFGGKPGGRLRLGSALGEYVVERHTTLDSRLEDRGNISVLDPEGKQAESAELIKLLAGVDEATFNNVFACGLREIQELGSLDDTRAAELLYKLTTGFDRVSLIDVMRELITGRERLLGPEEGRGTIPQLMAKRDKLKAEIDERSSATRRWSELAAQRVALADEAKQLTDAIAQSEANSRVMQAALEVQNPWNSRADIERQLSTIKEVKQLPEKATEKLDGYSRRVVRGKKRLRKLREQWLKLRGEVNQIVVNKLLLTQANRIEAICEHSQWMVSLDDHIRRIKGEIARLDDEIQTQLGSVAGRANLDELSADNYAALKRPAAAMREETEKLEQARKELEQANHDAERMTSKLASSARNRQVDDLQEAIHAAGERVALLRRRVQVEERLEQLTRRREELEFDGEELTEYQETPMRVSALVGVTFSVGVMLILLGWMGNILLPGSITNPIPYAIFGLMLSGGSALAKLLVDRNNEDTYTDNHRSQEQLRMQLAEAKQQRDDLDAELPGTGSLDSRLREAEAELRELERLSPLTGEHAASKDRLELATRRFAAAQESVKEVRNKWKQVLRQLGLPEDFAPSKVKHVVRSNDQVVELRRRKDTKRDELDAKEREMLVIVSRIKQLMGDLRITPSSDDPQSQLRQLAQVLQDEKDLEETRKSYVIKMKKLQRERGKFEDIVRSASRKRNALFVLAGVKDAKAFKQVAADTLRAADLRRVMDELTSRITVTLAGQFTEEAIAAVFKKEGRDLQTRWNQRASDMETMRKQLASVHERRGACLAEMQMLVADKRLAHAQLDLGVIEKQLDEAICRWQVLGVVSRVLETVRKSYETDRQPETLREASQYLNRLTLGHYERVWMPLDRRELLVDSAEGKQLPLDVLSRGTRESVYISLRLALAASFARRGATLPLVLDDVLVNFDTQRVRNAAELFREFAQGGNQIVMFTCHEHIMRLFKEASIDVRVLPSRGQDEEKPEPVVEKPKRKKKAEPVQELPPPEPPTIFPEQEPTRIPFDDDANAKLDEAAEEEVWFDVVNEFEVKKKQKKAKAKPAKAAEPELPQVWPLAPIAPVAKAVDIAPLPDHWPIAASPLPSRQDEPAETNYGGKLLRTRRRRFTWDSPEVYWEDYAPETIESVQPTATFTTAPLVPTVAYQYVPAMTYQAPVMAAAGAIGPVLHAANNPLSTSSEVAEEYGRYVVIDEEASRFWDGE